MSQPGYDPNQYQQPYQAPPQPYDPSAYPAMHAMGYSPEYLAGKKVAETSLLFGILGLFVLGFVFGPLAIINANKAERMGFPATAGKVLGWIASGLSALGVVITVLILVGLAASGTR
jgi:vacuolar-type H+-ATPase subunit I/STV1